LEPTHIARLLDHVEGDVAGRARNLLMRLPRGRERRRVGLQLGRHVGIVAGVGVEGHVERADVGVPVDRVF